MNIVGIIQARMSSTRLPGKVLMPIIGRPMLELQLERLRKIPLLTSWVIATSTDPSDDILYQFASKAGIPCYRGSLSNVLDRYYECARLFNADAIVRITGDCPVIDPVVSSAVVSYFVNHPQLDYVSNTLERSYPRGLDTEIFSMEALTKTKAHAQSDSQKEHVTLHMYSNPKDFRLHSIKNNTDLSEYRLTVDTSEDFQLIDLIYNKIYPYKPDFLLNDILTLYKSEPGLPKMNHHIEQKKA